MPNRRHRKGDENNNRMSSLLYATGQRRPLILMYEIGTTDTVNHFIDSLLNDWSKVVYLYNLVHDFAEHLKSGEFYRTPNRQ